jgi:hypothetical protein
VAATATILRPRLGESLEVVCLDDSALSVWVHWTGRRSVPHLRGPNGCESCKNGQPARLYAYFSAWCLKPNLLGLAEVTEYALSRCPELTEPSRERPLRGRHMLLKREKGHRQSRCTVQVLEAVKHGQLPGGVNVREVLEHLWGTDTETRRSLGMDDDGTNSEKGGRYDT